MEDHLKNENDHKNEDDLENEKDHKNEDDLKNEDNLKNEDDLKNEDIVKNENYLIWETVPSPSLHSINCACLYSSSNFFFFTN